ncbi:O-antigen ligase family protein [Micrococcus terreus]|uniref:O-antigen ligase family protein n=1 Tax=Micrococcus terreus TaxID=574650 RepID=UPI0033E2C6EB
MSSSPSSWLSPVLVFGPLFLAVLAHSGQIKYLGWLPVDATFLATGVVFLCVLAALIDRPWLDNRLWWVLSLWILFLFPVAGMADNSYGLQKVFTLFTITLACVVGPFFLLRTARQQKVFFETLIALAVIFTAMSWQAGILRSDYGVGGELEAGTDVMNPLSFARVVAPGLVVMTAYGFTRGRSVPVRFAWLGLAAVMLVLLFATGRRGPIVSIIASVVVMVALAPAFKKRRGRTISLAVVSALVAGWFVIRNDNAGAQRILGFFAGESDASTSAREYIWAEAFDVIGASPWGVGWGNFPTVTDMESLTAAGGRMYPHNIFLEGLTEGGWLVGAALSVFLAVGCYRAVTGATDTLGVAILGLVVSGMVNAFVSGDLNDQKVLWIALAMAFITRPEAGRHALDAPPDLATSRPTRSRRLTRTP